jgi:hypothetical protein
MSGMALTFVFVALIPASVIALVGTDNLTQVATLSWGRALGQWAYYTANIFALLAMLTSYWGLGAVCSPISSTTSAWAAKPKIKTAAGLAVVALPPFLLAYSGIASFVNALYFAGTFGGVLMGIIPVLLLNAARRRGDASSEFVCGWYAHRSVQWLIVATFFLSGGMLWYALFGVLPVLGEQARSAGERLAVGARLGRGGSSRVAFQHNAGAQAGALRQWPAGGRYWGACPDAGAHRRYVRHTAASLPALLRG